MKKSNPKQEWSRKQNRKERFTIFQVITFKYGSISWSGSLPNHGNSIFQKAVISFKLNFSREQVITSEVTSKWTSFSTRFNYCVLYVSQVLGSLRCLGHQNPCQFYSLKNKQFWCLKYLMLMNKKLKVTKHLVYVDFIWINLF